MELFKLVGSIAVDNASANKSIDDTTKKTSNLGNKLGSGIKTAAKWGAKIATAGVAAGTIAAGGVMKLSNSSASAADRIDKMSQKIGISRKSYQELDFACSQSGTSVDSLKMGIKTLTSVMDTTAAGTSKSKTALEQLGVAATDSSGKLRGQEEVMWECFSKLQSLGNQTEKARLATELFGKSGSELMPMLNGASGSIEEMRKKANELGLVMSDKAVDSGVKFTDSMDQAKRSIQALANKAGSALLPSLNNIVQGFIGLVTGQKKSTSQIEKGFNDLIAKITSNIPKVLQVITPLASALFNEAPKLIESLLSGILSALPQLVSRFAEMLMKLIETIVLMLPQFIEAGVKAIVSLAQGLSQQLPTLIPLLINGLLDAVMSLLNNMDALVDAGIQMIQSMTTGITNALPQLIDRLPDILLKMVDVILENTPKMIVAGYKVVIQLIVGIVKALPQLWSKIPYIFSELGKKILSFGGKVASWFGRIFSGAWNKIKSVFSPFGDFFSGLWEKIKSIFGKVGGFFKNVFSGAVSAVKNVFGGIVEVVKKPINVIIGGLNTFIGGLNKIKIPDWVPSVGGKGINIPTIPELEKGGVLERGQVGLLEGNGSEAVVPLEKNTGWLDQISFRLANLIGNNSNDETNQKLGAIITLLQEIVGTDRIEEIRKALEGTDISWNKREIGRVVKSLA